MAQPFPRGIPEVLILLGCWIVSTTPAPAAEVTHLAVPAAYTESWGSLRGAVRVNHQAALFAGQPLEEMMEMSLAFGIYPAKAATPLKGADLLLVIQQPAHRCLKVAPGWKLQILEGKDRRSAVAVSLLACVPGDGEGFIVGNWIASARSAGSRVCASAGLQAGSGRGLRGADVIGGIFGGFALRLWWRTDLHFEFGGNLETGFVLVGTSIDLGPHISAYFAVPTNLVNSEDLEVLEPEIAGGMRYSF